MLFEKKEKNLIGYVINHKIFFKKKKGIFFLNLKTLMKHKANIAYHIYHIDSLSYNCIHWKTIQLYHFIHLHQDRRCKTFYDYFFLSNREVRQILKELMIILFLSRVLT